MEYMGASMPIVRFTGEILVDVPDDTGDKLPEDAAYELLLKNTTGFCQVYLESVYVGCGDYQPIEPVVTRFLQRMKEKHGG